MIKWISLIAIAAALVCGAADARDVSRGNRVGGTAGFAPDGSFIEGAGATFSPVTGSATSLLTNFGVWTLGPYRSDIQPHWGGGDMYPLYANGHRVAPQAQRFLVDFGGFSFLMEEDEIVWQWGSYQELPNAGVYPSAAAPAFVYVPGPPTWPPASTTPPVDGTAIFAPTGTLANEYGVWSWGNAQTGGYEVRLNGNTVLWNSPHLVASQMQINSNGQLFAQRPDSSWVVILDYAVASASAPTGQAIPLHVDMVPTGPLAGHTAVSPACGDLIFRLPNVGSVGRLAGYLTVPMSDGSNFAGTVTINANGGITLFNASVGGDGVIPLTSKQNPLYGLDNFAGISYSVSQNGTTVNGYNFWFDTGSCP